MKKHKVAYSAEAKYGMGDYYGKAIRQKMGKVRDLYFPGANPVSSKKLRKPPKTLA